MTREDYKFQMIRAQHFMLEACVNFFICSFYNYNKKRCNKMEKSALQYSTYKKIQMINYDDKVDTSHLIMIYESDHLLT